MKSALTLLAALIALVAAQNSQAADEAPAAPPSTTGLAYKGINIDFGGFIASESVYRSSNTASDIATSYLALPFQNSQGYGFSEFRGSARQSRFSLLAKGNADSNTHLAGYYELDFLGAAPTANSKESNSFTPRTRHVYMTMDWDDLGLHLLGGQTWSLATMNAKGITPRSEQLPNTIEGQYAVGFDWARQWQLRLTKDWNKEFWLALSLENAQTVNVSGNLPAGFANVYTLPAGALMSVNPSINGYPDIVAKFAWESDLGHFEVYNLARNFQSRYSANTASSSQNPTLGTKQSLWTDDVGGGISVPLFQKKLEVTVSGLYGKGAGRYGTSQFADATYGGDGSLSPLIATQYLAQLTWHALSNLDTYVTYGQEKVNSAVGPGSTYGYGDGVVASNLGCTFLGGTCAPQMKQTSQVNVGAWWNIYKGSYGLAKLGAQFSHTELQAFADNSAFSPRTKMNMVFTSLRYYPF